MVHYIHSSKNCIESLNATLGGDEKMTFQSGPQPIGFVSDDVGANFQNPLYVSASSNNSWGNNNVGSNCQANQNLNNSIEPERPACKEPKVVSGRTRHLSHTYEPECKKNSDDDHEYSTTIVENCYHHHHNRTLVTDKNHHHHHHHKTIVRDNHIHHNHLKNVIRDNHFHHHHYAKEHKSTRLEDPKCCVKTQHLTRRFECYDSDSDSDSIDSISSIGSDTDDDYFSDSATEGFLRVGRSRRHRNRRHQRRHSLDRHYRHNSHRPQRRRRYSNSIETRYEESEAPASAYHHILQTANNGPNIAFDPAEYRCISSRNRSSHRRRHNFNHHDHFDKSERKVRRRYHSFSDSRRKRSQSINNFDDYELRKRFQDLLKRTEPRSKQSSLSASTSFSRDKSKKQCPYEALKKAQEAAIHQGYTYTCYPGPISRAAPVDYCCYPSPPTPPPPPCFYPAYPPGPGGFNHHGFHPSYY